MTKKIYTAHIKPGEGAEIEKVLFVKEGVSLFALLLGVIWALYYRIWWLALIIIVVNVIITNLVKNIIITSEAGVILHMIVNVILALYGNDLYRLELKRRGYLFKQVVSGCNMLEAKCRLLDFYDRRQRA